MDCSLCKVRSSVAVSWKSQVEPRSGFGRVRGEISSVREWNEEEWEWRRPPRVQQRMDVELAGEGTCQQRRV